MTEMPAIAIDDFGARPALHNLPRPEPAEDEVLVRVQASSINGFDVAVSRGTIGDMPYEFPIMLGRDFAGTIEAVGAAVTGFEIGGRVFGVNMKPRLGEPLHDGTFAEFTSVPAEFVATIPDEVTTEVAGALGLAGSAALAAVDAVAPGADDTVDHTDDLAAAVHSSHPDGVDAIVHLAGDIEALVALLKPGGRPASTLAVDNSGRAAAVTRVNATLERQAFESLAASVAEGDLIVPIRATYTLADVPRALDDFTTGSQGKLSIGIPESVRGGPPNNVHLSW
jgi:NADPH:quinone reductase-like Zn-dependent oxidoreductase